MAITNFPAPKKLRDLPIHGFEGLLDTYTKEKLRRKELGDPEPARLLVPAPDFAELIDMLFGLRISPRMLQRYTSSKLNLLPPTVSKEGHPALYVYPDHLEIVAVFLTLRLVYGLPLKTIRQLLEHFPAEGYHLILGRNSSTDDLFDLAHMLPKGFKVGDLMMANTCDVMVQDLLSPNQALLAATQPGDALRELEEKLILGRLEEIKEWVKSGRRQQFVSREGAERFRELAEKKLSQKKIARKILARRG